MKLLVLWAFLLPLAALAQVQKCQINGKTVYSDSECGQAGVELNLRQNTIETSGLRAQIASDKEQAAAAQRQQAATAAKAARGGKPGPCDGIIPVDHKPSARQRNEYRQCRERQTREYNRTSN